MNTRTIRRVAVYARLSVTTEESVSIARQVDSARAYATARGWEVVLVATDDGVSATKNKPEDRIGWRKVLDSPERFEAVIVWKVDRLARRVLDFLHADAALQERGAGLVAVEDPIDMTTAQGRAFATMLAVFGEMEAAAISARVTAARRALVHAGRRVGGRPPFGFRNVANPDGPGMVLAHDPDTIDAVREAAARAIAGESTYSIARWLESSGVKPRTRKGRKNDDQWHEVSVETFLRAPALAGMTPYTPGRKPGEKDVTVDVLRDTDGMPVVDESIAIMTPGEWRTMIATLDAGKRPGTRPRAGAEVALLYGLATCAGCGGLLHRASTAGGKFTYYRCQNRACDAKVSISRPSLEQYVVDTVLDVAGHLPVVRVELEGGQPATALADIEAAIADTLARMAEVDDDDEEARLASRLRSLKSARRDARAADVAPVERRIGTGMTFREAMDAMTDTAERRDVLRSALDAVVVDVPGSRGRTFDPSRVTLAWTHVEEDYNA